MGAYDRDAMTRRDFLTRTGAAVAGLAVAGTAAADDKKTPVRIGDGPYRYELVEGWGAPPPGMSYEWGCAVVVDSQDRVYVHTRASRAVLVFDRDGKLLDDFGAEFAGTGHGMYWHQEGPDEFLYFCDHPRNLMVKTDLRGRVLMRIGKDVDPGPDHFQFNFNQPTDLAIAPNGDIYVAEGYGGNMVHQFDKNGKFIRTIGRPGKAPGEFQTPHGIWIDTRKGDPEIYVADRTNGRIQIFTLDGRLKRTIADGIVRNPCCFYPYKGKMYIPDLDHRVTVLDEHDHPVAQLGDGRGMKDEDLQSPLVAAFRAPHALTLDSRGDLYVVEWVQDARLRKFRRVPA